MSRRLSRKSLVVIGVVVMLVTAFSGGAAAAGDGTLVTASENSSATELGNGTLSNAQVERSGEAGLVGHDVNRSSAAARYAMDYGSGTTAYDHVGSADLSLSGATWTSGLRGQALSFDGTDDSASASTDFGRPQNMTFTTAFKLRSDVPSTGGAADEIYVAGMLTGSNDIISLDIRSGNFYTSGVGNEPGVTIRFGTSGFVTLGSGVSVSTGTWHTLKATYDGSTMRLYLDGELVATKNVGEQIDYAGADTLVVGSRGDGTRLLDGTVDEVRAYSEALSSGLATRLSKSPDGKLSPAATERWGFDAGAGSTAFGDEGHDGSLTNATWTPGTVGQAVEFTGDGQMAVPDGPWADIGASESMTVAGWVNTTDATGVTTLFTTREANSNGIIVSLDNGQAVAKVGDGTDSAGVQGTTDLSDGNWHHIALRLNRSTDTLALYIDGTQVDTADATAVDGISPSNDVILGADRSGNEQLTGALDEWRLLKQSVPTDSIQQINQNPAAEIPEDGSYSAEHTASGDLKAYTDVELRNETATVTVQGWDGSSWSDLTTKTYTTSGNKTFDFSAPGYDKVRTKVVFNRSDPDHLGRLHDEGIQFTNDAPQVDNTTASPTGDLQQNQITFEINVSDTQLGTAQGDELTVDWYIDGAKDATTTVTSNGTASYSTSGLNGGDHTWHVVVTDDYGASVTSQTFSLSVPSKLAIRNESNPNQLVTGAELELTFYYSNQVIVKEDDNGDGYINMTGLPVDQKFVVVATADGYLNRHIIVDSIYEQSSIYLIPDNATAVEVRFNINDPTGRFTSGDTEVIIQRAITRDFDDDGTNETQFVNVAADEAGVAGFSTFLVQDARYRLKVRNQGGDVRILGAFTATASEQVTLKPVPLGIDTGGETAYNYTAWQSNVSGTERITFEFADNANATTDMTVSIWEQGNQSHQPDGWTNATVSGPLGSTKIVHPLDPSDADTTWVVKFEASRDGETISGEVIVGPNIRNPLTGDAPAWLLQAAALTVIVMTGALFSKLNTGVGAVTTSFVAGGFWWAGFLPPEAGGAVVIVLVVSVLYKTQGDR